MMRKMSVIELVQDTIQYYKTHPRGVLTSLTSSPAEPCTCYNPTTGAMCAVGRCMISPGEHGQATVSELRSWDEIKEEYVGGIDHVLKEEYRGHSVDTWKRLQSLHDHRGNWEQVGEGFVLNEEGKENAKNITSQAVWEGESELAHSEVWGVEPYSYEWNE